MAVYEPDARGLIVACPSCDQKNRLAYDRLSERVRCARCKTEIPAPASPIDIHNSADFDRLVASASVPVIVDYWAPWCGPCRMVAPEVKKLAKTVAGKALVLKVDTERVPDVAGRFGIQSIPTFIVFKNGEPAVRESGARNESGLKALVERAA
jgi:thioredoxin 2